MSIFEEKPEAIFEDIKELLSKGAKDRKHAFHTPVFSSSSKIKSVDSRVIVLRKFDEEDFTLNFHTDYRSPKILDLKHNNQSNFVFYDPILKIQLRVKTLSKIHYSDDVALEAWKQTRLFSRKCYLTMKAPSSVTFKPEDGIEEHLKNVDPGIDESEMGYLNFSVIKNAIQDIDWLYLSSSGHRRLKIILKNKNPIFEWIIP